MNLHCHLKQRRGFCNIAEQGLEEQVEVAGQRVLSRRIPIQKAPFKSGNKHVPN